MNSDTKLQQPRKKTINICINEMKQKRGLLAFYCMPWNESGLDYSSWGVRRVLRQAITDTLPAWSDTNNGITNNNNK